MGAQPDRPEYRSDHRLRADRSGGLPAPAADGGSSHRRPVRPRRDAGARPVGRAQSGGAAAAGARGTPLGRRRAGVLRCARGGHCGRAGSRRRRAQRDRVRERESEAERWHMCTVRKTVVFSVSCRDDTSLAVDVRLEMTAGRPIERMSIVRAP